jgi:hypothetical protein
LLGRFVGDDRAVTTEGTDRERRHFHDVRYSANRALTPATVDGHRD